MANRLGIGIDLHDSRLASVEGVAGDDLATALRRQLAPNGPLESLICDQILAAAQAKGLRAEQRLATGLQSLVHLRQLRFDAPAIPAPIAVFDRNDENDVNAWRARLSWEPAISEDSPTVRGTWITVDQVVSRIVDGWSWGDILRTHPELCEDDIRACLTFTVEHDGMG